jgi:hypothetical protein
MRICPRCGSGLKQGWGYEKSSIERAGNPLEVDEFHCTGCGRRYLHSYEERFSGDIESWSCWSDETDGWEFLDKAGWPTSGQPPDPKPAPAPREAGMPKPAGVAHGPWSDDTINFLDTLPREESSVVHLPHFNNQAVLVYDRETGLHEEIDREAFPDDARYWRGFYMPHGAGFIGVYATSLGPMVFVGPERTLARQGVTHASVADEGKRRRFRLEHAGEELISLRYTPLPSGFDCWSQDEAIVDFYIWLERNTDDPKWYSYYTVPAGDDVSWRDGPPEPDPGPYFGEYALVWDRETGEFPERFRVLGEGELPVDFPDRADWTGSVNRAQLDALMQRLREQYPPPRHLAVTMYGDDWSQARKKFLEIFGADA